MCILFIASTEHRVPGTVWFLWRGIRQTKYANGNQSSGVLISTRRSPTLVAVPISISNILLGFAWLYCDAILDLSIQIIWCERACPSLCKKHSIIRNSNGAVLLQTSKYFLFTLVRGRRLAHARSTMCLELDEFVSISKNMGKIHFRWIIIWNENKVIHFAWAYWRTAMRRQQINSNWRRFGDVHTSNGGWRAKQQHKCDNYYECGALLTNRPPKATFLCSSAANHSREIQ